MIISPYFHCTSIKTFSGFFIPQIKLICNPVFSLSSTYPGVIEFAGGAVPGSSWDPGCHVQAVLKLGPSMLQCGVLLMLQQEQQTLAVFLKAYFGLYILYHFGLSFGE